MYIPRSSRPIHWKFLIFGSLILSMIVSIVVSSVQAQTARPDVESRLLSIPEADYPSVAKQASVGGVVNVRVDINEIGHVTNAVVMSGPGWVCPAVATPAVVALRKAAVAAALRANFSPALSGSTAVRSINTVTVQFGAVEDPEPTTALVGNVKISDPAIPAPENGVRIQGDTSPVPLRHAAENPARPKTVSGGVLNGKAISLSTPVYPAAAKAVRASGAVAVQVTITEQGTVYSARPVYGHPLLRAAATQAACGSSFPPTLLSGEPVQVMGVITYNFNL